MINPAVAQKIPLHPNPPPLIRVSGSHREIGRQIGEACSRQVRQSIANATSLLASAYGQLELTWEGAQIHARKYMPFAQERYPKYVDELLGMAEGAGVSYEDLTVVNAMEAVTTDALHLTKCTSIAVNGQRTSDGHVLIAHNEDWVPEDEDGVYVVHATPDDDPPFLAMTYGGLLPNIGFNAAGIAQCCDSVYPDDARIGIPRLIVSRGVLAARTPADAMRHMLAPHRAAGYNHLLVHESGEMYNVEVSARRFATLYGQEGMLVHTNHYLAPTMREIESQPEELISSQVRYFRAMRLVKRVQKHSVKSLQTIQKDHVNYSNSICNHAVETEIALDREKTVNAMVIDLTARQMHISWGNPCENPYHTYHLDA
jgi:isopenicillin-N N-acyltransferase-like protein